MLGLGAFAKKLFGSANDRYLSGLRPKVDAINALESDMAALSDTALKAKTDDFRKRLDEGAKLDDLEGWQAVSLRGPVHVLCMYSFAMLRRAA